MVPALTASTSSGAAALPDPEAGEGIVSLFIHAAGDLKHNFFAAFTDATAQWHGLNAFFNDIFVPYLVGSILPGIIAAIACYYLALPIITAYQNRRRAKIKERLTQIRHAMAEAVATMPSHGEFIARHCAAPPIAA